MKLGTNDIGSVYLGTNAVQKVYLGTNEVWTSFTIDADYQAILDYATTQGYTLPSSSQQVLQNQLVVDLKTAGIWSKLHTFAVFATDGDSDFALIDWKRLSDYTAFNSPTFTANQGYKGNGSSSYVDSNYSMASPISQNNMHCGGYAFGDATGYSFVFGVDSGSNDVMISPDFNDGLTFVRVNSTGRGSFENLNTTGVYIASRDGLSSVNAISPNGTILSNTTTSVTGIPSGNLTSHRWGTLYGDSTIAIVHAGVDVTSELSDFRTALNNYMTSI